MIIIPTHNDNRARWFSDIALDGQLYRLAFNWSVREDAWYLSIYTTSDVLILAGVKLVVQYRLLQQYHAITGMPPGDIIVADIQDNIVDAVITYDNLGERFKVVYLTEAEIMQGGI